MGKNSFLQNVKVFLHGVKCQQLRPEFELRSAIPFLTMITVTLHPPSKVCVEAATLF